MDGLQRGLTLGISFLTALIFFGWMITIFIDKKIASTKSTPFKFIPQILKRMKIKQGEALVDLGCGDGTFAIEACREKKGVVVGIEMSPMHIILVKIKKIFLFLFKGEKINMQIIPENFLKIDKNAFIDTDIIYMNQPQSILNHFEHKAQGLILEGVRIYTLNRKFKGITAVKEEKLDSDNKLYEY